MSGMPDAWRAWRDANAWVPFLRRWARARRLSSYRGPWFAEHLRRLEGR